jgi:hypothetical protein
MSLVGDRRQPQSHAENRNRLARALRKLGAATRAEDGALSPCPVTARDSAADPTCFTPETRYPHLAERTRDRVDNAWSGRLLCRRQDWHQCPHTAAGGPPRDWKVPGTGQAVKIVEQSDKFRTAGGTAPSTRS